MGFLFAPSPKLVDASSALPGRAEPVLANPRVHEVLGTPTTGPWREGQRRILIGIGCFWGAERIFWQQAGVVTTAAGYMGGHTPNPTYEETCTGLTGHTESVLVAYDPEQTVMGLIASGGELSYVAPSAGRAIGPFFDMLDLTPALEQSGTDNHQGDDISVEAIAKSNPDWLIVMDRDAAIGEENATAAELIERSEALQDVTAVKEGNIVYLPADFYVAEDIQNHTTVMEDLAKAFEGAQ